MESVEWGVGKRYHILYLMEIFGSDALWNLSERQDNVCYDCCKEGNAPKYFLNQDVSGDSCLGLFHLQMIISFPFLSAKDLRTSLLIMRTHSFLTLLYVGGIYARLVYTW